MYFVCQFHGQQVHGSSYSRSLGDGGIDPAAPDNAQDNTVRLPSYLSIYLLIITYPPAYLSICLSVNMPAHLSTVCLSILSLYTDHSCHTVYQYCLDMSMHFR